jgi:glycosyltransferase involved in cell wall biosynthesis
MSMMLLEAVSLQTPVIASDIESNISIFSADEVLFFKKGDHEDLAEKIVWAFSNEGLMKKKAEYALKKIKRLLYLGQNSTLIQKSI